jgi:hypothetical protein
MCFFSTCVPESPSGISRYKGDPRDQVGTAADLDKLIKEGLEDKYFGRQSTSAQSPSIPMIKRVFNDLIKAYRILRPWVALASVIIGVLSLFFSLGISVVGSWCMITWGAYVIYDELTQRWCCRAESPKDMNTPPDMTPCTEPSYLDSSRRRDSAGSNGESTLAGVPYVKNRNPPHRSQSAVVISPPPDEIPTDKAFNSNARLMNLEDHQKNQQNSGNNSPLPFPSNEIQNLSFNGTPSNTIIDESTQEEA